MVTLQRSPLRGLHVPFVVQTLKSPFCLVRLCRLVWLSQKNSRCFSISEGDLATTHRRGAEEPKREAQPFGFERVGEGVFGDRGLTFV